MTGVPQRLFGSYFIQQSVNNFWRNLHFFGVLGRVKVYVLWSNERLTDLFIKSNETALFDEIYLTG